MVEELAPELDIGTIHLEPGIPFYYAAWGMRYRFKGGDWRIVDMSFRKKSDAENWLGIHIFPREEGVEKEVIPVKRTLLIDQHGTITSKTEELTEELG